MENFRTSRNASEIGNHCQPFFASFAHLNTTLWLRRKGINTLRQDIGRSSRCLSRLSTHYRLSASRIPANSRSKNVSEVCNDKGEFGKKKQIFPGVLFKENKNGFLAESYVPGSKLPILGMVISPLMTESL